MPLRGMIYMVINDSPKEVSKGVFEIEIPVPFGVKYVNAYLIDSGVLGLIDPGPKTSKAINVLREALGKLGVSLADVERLIFTHRHVDHIGMGNTIRMISNAQTYIHESEKNAASDFYEEFDKTVKSLLIPVSEAGVSKQILEKIPEYYGIIREVCEPVEIDKALKDGDTLNFGEINLNVIHCPGHSLGSICLYEKERRLLFTGDHVLKEITPNPFASGLSEHATLRRYLDSLKKVEKLSVETGLPGHGSLIYDFPSVVRDLYAHHEARKKLVAEILRGGPKTPFEVSKEMFGNLPMSEILLGLAEAAGHLEELSSENRVESFKKGNLIYFRMVG
jgi:glyoxylase-like metal-dependent hydrolase (beta-lactamase superfamily II)